MVQIARGVNSGHVRRLGVHGVVLLGHETYYPRFGFAPASRWNLTGDYGRLDAFQFLPLPDAADSIRDGQIRNAPEFTEVFRPGSESPTSLPLRRKDGFQIRPTRWPVRNLPDGQNLTGRFRYRPMMRADARWTGRACEA